MIAVPPPLQPGDTLAILATARWIAPEALHYATSVIESWGFKVVCGKHVHTQHFQLAGTDEERAADLQWALDNPDIKAVIVARGGYGTVRLLDRVDWSALHRQPKWICGYSDITALHTYVNNLGIASIHSTMPVSFADATPQALESLRHALTGELKDISWSTETVESFETAGIMRGGNLSVLYSLLGSTLKPFEDDTILFLEDVDEMLYHVDRMMTALMRAGILQNVKAIICGGFTQMKDNTTAFGFNQELPWGFDAVETIQRIAGESGIPVVTGFQAGHLSHNCAFYLNNRAALRIDNGVAELMFA